MMEDNAPIKMMGSGVLKPPPGHEKIPYVDAAMPKVGANLSGINVARASRHQGSDDQMFGKPKRGKCSSSQRGNPTPPVVVKIGQASLAEFDRAQHETHNNVFDAALRGLQKTVQCTIVVYRSISNVGITGTSRCVEFVQRLLPLQGTGASKETAVGAGRPSRGQNIARVAGHVKK